MDIHQRDQPHVGKVLRRHCGHHVFCPGIPPRPPPVDARLQRAMRVQAKRTQAGCPCTRLPPLSPGDHPHSTPHPYVQLFERPSSLGVLEVVHPATQDRSELLEGPLQTLSAPLQTQVCDPRPQACKTLRRNPQTGLLVRGHAVAQELAHPGPGHHALGRVHRELQAFPQERCHPTSPRCVASYPLPVRQASALPSGFFQTRSHPRNPCQWLTIPLAGLVEDFHLLVGAPCRAHHKKGPPFRAALG